MKRILLVIVIIITLLILLVISVRLSNWQQEKVKPTPTPKISIRPTYPPLPTSSSLPINSPEDQKKVIEKVKSRAPLAEGDTTIRNRLISSVGNKSAVLKTSPSYKIEYFKPADVFQVEILSADISGAKEQAVTWFKSQGISQEGICNLPIIFNLNWEVARQIRGKNIQFNPLPEGC